MMQIAIARKLDGSPVGWMEKATADRYLARADVAEGCRAMDESRAIKTRLRV